jgi:eukaryotic-like serine/threonine-protein kinase
MDPERWQRIAHVYESALQQEPAERGAFLAEASGSDEELRREVESLLAHDSTPVLLDRPMLEAAAAVFTEQSDLEPGTHLGPYRIDVLLGAGGMGQVYRAIDTRLNRTVAIKVLPPTLATDAQSRARFDREAQAIAGLTHPHVCTLHDVGHQDGVDFLVMEYLEGETLAARLENGPLTLDHALKCSIEIADALAAAHRHGVIHRDVKPSNVILTRNGAKLLDFGLAKPTTSVIAGGASFAPTTPPGVTAQGTILGTFQYMAPEQLEGKDADARTDIFAFGAVVYETLTGKKAFDGTSQASVIGAIMHADPPAITTVQPLTPPALDRIVKTCLAKDPDDRWQTARDLSRELQWVGHAPSATDATRRPSAGRYTLLGGVAVVVMAAISGYAAWTLKPAPSPSEAVTRFSFTLPEDVRFTRGIGGHVAISPDGSRIVLAANDQLYLRNMADEEFHPISGTDDQNPSSPFFSPDGQRVAFWTPSGGGMLKRIAVTGGAAAAIAETREPLGASWGEDNQILLGQGPNGIQRVSSDGGRPETIISVNVGEIASSPQILPDGEHVLFTLGEQGLDADITRQRNWDLARIVVQSVKSGNRKVLINGGYDARYSPPRHIVYAVASTLWARPLDLSRLQVIGEPISIVEAVRTRGQGRYSTGVAEFSFASNGAMAYVPEATRSRIPTRSVALIDVRGTVTPLDLPAGPYHSPRFSVPDGKQIALYTTDGVIWVYDLSGRKAIRRLTPEGGNLLPTWTRDGRLVFWSTVAGQTGLFRQHASGSDLAERLTESVAPAYFPYSVSADGKTLFLGSDRRAPRQAILTLSLNGGDTTPEPVFQGEKGDVVFSPSLSPDGRWLAYELRHENKNNIYVDPFPPTGVHHPVTTDGGHNPMWSRDGRRLFYVREAAAENGSATFYSVEVLGTGGSFEYGKANALFSVDGLFIQGSGPGNIVDISPDGRQFVTLLLPPQTDGEPEPFQVNVVLNWFADLRQRVPVK